MARYDLDCRAGQLLLLFCLFFDQLVGQLPNFLVLLTQYQFDRVHLCPVLGLLRWIGLSVLTLSEFFDRLPTNAAERPFQVFKTCQGLWAILGTLINLSNSLCEIIFFLNYAAKVDSRVESLGCSSIINESRFTLVTDFHRASWIPLQIHLLLVTRSHLLALSLTCLYVAGPSALIALKAVTFLLL